MKGHDVLIRAAAQVVRSFPHVTFTIAGEVLEADYFEALKRLVEELGLVQQVRFVGRVTDTAAHLQRADVFVLPSRSEGFSNSLVEAMALAMPVIATAVGGNAEAIQDGVSGLIVPAEDALALTSALLRVLQYPEQAQNMGEAARQTVQQWFTTEAMLRTTTNVYAKLLQRG